MALAWIVVANHSHARIFEAEKRNGALQEIKTLSHPQARLRGRDITADSPGRSFDSMGMGRHAMSGRSSIRQQQAREFARQVAALLDEGKKNGAYKKLFIIADPAIMGNLRDSLKPYTLATVAGEISKNLVTHDLRAVRAALPGYL